MGDYNTKICIYPDGHNRVVYSNGKVFGSSDHIDSEYDSVPSSDFETPFYVTKRSRCTSDEADTRLDSVLRSKQKVFDICYCNDWDYFFTGTFDPKLLDYNDPKLVRKKISRFMSNMVQRRGLRYLLVPEYFKKGVGIHFHCLCNDVFKLRFSGRYHTFGYNGTKVKVYNVLDWRYGFSTAIPISGDRVRLSCYVTKYISKSSDRIFGKYYLSSNNLNRSPQVVYGNTDFDSVDLDSYTSWRNDLLFKYENNISITYK